MLGYSGPLHVVWNAFRSQIESCSLWEWWRSVFAAILAVVGVPMVRRRFIALSSLTPSEVKIVSSFGAKVVDWKWEYMETSFDKLTDGVDIFFQKLHVPTLKQAAGQEEGGRVTIDGKCWVLLQATQAAGWDKFSALLGFFAVFLAMRWAEPVGGTKVARATIIFGRMHRFLQSRKRKRCSI